MFIPLTHRVVYGLLDPRDGLIKYIGVTENPIYRYKQHMQEAKRKPRSTNSTSKKNLWIQEMVHSNLHPLLVLLDSIPAVDSEKAEQYWITHFDKFGFLLNHQIEKTKNLK